MKKNKAKYVPKPPVKKAVKSVGKAGILVNFRLSPAELKLVRANAKRFAKGNVSEWLRTAGIGFKSSSVVVPRASR